MKIDKNKLKDNQARPLTQSLFLEIGYNTEFAVYTLDEEDKMYKGKLYPSLKKLFINMEDPTEYEFARTYLLGWKHWQRMNENKVLRTHFDEWREELEVALRATAIRKIIEVSLDDGNFQASRWLAEKGWDKRKAGRPSNAEIDRERKVQADIHKLYEEDFKRVEKDGTNG